MREIATVNYHIKSAEPQAFQFDVDGVIGNLLSPELVATQVGVRDIRQDNTRVDFDTDGILFEQHESAIRNFEGRSWQVAYNDELRALLADKIGASEVIVFDHTVRTDNPSADRKPARNVHNDYSPLGADKRLIDLLGEALACEFRSGHYGFVNVWRPVDEPITEAPLGFIKPDSIGEEDWMTIELIYPDRTGQILGLAANQNHDWFYCSNMTPSEVVIFNIHDNGGRPCLGHSALDMQPKQAMPRQIRKSIESRTLVRY